jgi:hypothetical protein
MGDFQASFQMEARILIILFKYTCFTQAFWWKETSPVAGIKKQADLGLTIVQYLETY